MYTRHYQFKLKIGVIEFELNMHFYILFPYYIHSFRMPIEHGVVFLCGVVQYSFRAVEVRVMNEFIQRVYENNFYLFIWVKI